MIDPPLRALYICRRQARVVRNAPSRWTARSLRQASKVRSTMDARCWYPALLTRTSMPPKRSIALATPASTWRSSVTSIATAIAVPPARSISPTTILAGSSCKSAMQTFAPSRANARAISRPRPLAAPVTMAALSFICIVAPLLQRSFQPAAQLADDAAPEGEHADHEDQSLSHRHPRPQPGKGLQSDDHHRSHHRPEDRPHPAEQRHQDDLARGPPVHIRQRRKLKHDRFRSSRQSGEGGGDHENDHLVVVRLVSQRNRPRLILPDPLQHLTEGRMNRPVDDEKPQGEDPEHHEIHRHRVAQVEQPKHPAPRHRLDAVLASGEARSQIKEISHLRQRQGDHREVDALAANGNRAYHRPDRRGERCTEKDRQFRRQPPHLRGMGRRVSRRAEEQGVAERKQTYVADEQIEGASEQRKTERLHQNDRVDDEGRGDEDREHGGDRNLLSPPTGRQRSGVCCCFHRGHLTALFQKVPRTSPAIPAP